MGTFQFSFLGPFSGIYISDQFDVRIIDNIRHNFEKFEGNPSFVDKVLLSKFSISWELIAS